MRRRRETTSPRDGISSSPLSRLAGEGLAVKAGSIVAALTPTLSRKREGRNRQLFAAPAATHERSCAIAVASRGGAPSGMRSPLMPAVPCTLRIR